MSSFSDYTEDKVLDHIHGGTAFTQPAAQYLELYTATPSDASRRAVPPDERISIPMVARRRPNSAMPSFR